MYRRHGIRAMLIPHGNTVSFFPSSLNNDPDAAINRVLKLLGWTCDETRGGDFDSALQRLQFASFPAVVGPLDYGFLTYHPNHIQLKGTDHYVTALAVEDETVRVHDPNGCPGATLPLADFMEAWCAEVVDFGPNKPTLQYVLRSNFHPTKTVNRAEVFQSAVGAIKEQLQLVIDDPTFSSGPPALRALATIVQDGCVAKPLRDLLIHFSLRVGAERCLDAMTFLHEANLEQAARHAEEKSRLYGAALYNAVHDHWDGFATQLNELADIEVEFIKALTVHTA